jgi:hypothetical protein
MNNSHPTQVSSLPNQQRNRRQRNMNNPINGSTVITAQSTAQPETQPEVNNAERDQLKDDSSDPKPYHVQDPQPEIQTNAEEDSLQREGPTQINTQVLDHENNFNAENTGAIISPHREGSVERNTQFDQFRHIDQPNFESEIGTNAQPIHVEDAPLRKRPLKQTLNLFMRIILMQKILRQILSLRFRQMQKILHKKIPNRGKGRLKQTLNLFIRIILMQKILGQILSLRFKQMQKILHKKIPNRGKGRLKQTLNLFKRIMLMQKILEILSLRFRQMQKILHKKIPNMEGTIETNAQLVHKNNFNTENTQILSLRFRQMHKILHKKIPNRGKGQLK